MYMHLKWCSLPKGLTHPGMKTYYIMYIKRNLQIYSKYLNNSLGAFCLSVMLQILADRVTIHKKLYRGRPKVSMCIFVVWLFCPCTTNYTRQENCCGWDRGGCHTSNSSSCKWVHKCAPSCLLKKVPFTTRHHILVPWGGQWLTIGWPMVAQWLSI